PGDLVFAPPIVVNPGRPASDMTLIRTAQGWRIASVDRTGSLVAIYSVTSTRPVAVLDTHLRHQRIAAADLNSDALDDLVVYHPLDGAVTVAFQVPARLPNFASGNNISTGGSPPDVAFSDVNGDGQLDILINNRSSGILTVLFNGPGHAFTEMARYRTG